MRTLPQGFGRYRREREVECPGELVAPCVVESLAELGQTGVVEPAATDLELEVADDGPLGFDLEVELRVPGWIDKSESRAQANLRSCLWRLNQCAEAAAWRRSGSRAEYSFDPTVFLRVVRITGGGPTPELPQLDTDDLVGLVLAPGDADRLLAIRAADVLVARSSTAALRTLASDASPVVAHAASELLARWTA